MQCLIECVCVRLCWAQENIHHWNPPKKKPTRVYISVRAHARAFNASFASEMFRQICANFLRARSQPIVVRSDAEFSRPVRSVRQHTKVNNIIIQFLCAKRTRAHSLCLRTRRSQTTTARRPSTTAPDTMYSQQVCVCVCGVCWRSLRAQAWMVAEFRVGARASSHQNALYANGMRTVVR